MFCFGHQRVILPRQESAAVVRTLIVAIAVPVAVLAKGTCIYIIVYSSSYNYAYLQRHV